MAVKERTTSFDIAQLAGVSQPTVSRALSGSPAVSEATRKRIEAIARQLNYTVDKNASSLRRRQSRTLALLFFEDPTPDQSLINPFFLSMLGSLTRTCALRGYDLLTSFQQLSSDWHVDYEDSHKADGIILLGYGDFEDYRTRLDQLVAQGTKFVRWGSPDQGAAGTVIGCDNVRGGELAGAHLVAAGRRRIAFVGQASSHYPEFDDRHRGLCQAVAVAGLDAEVVAQVDALNTQQAGYDAVHELVRRGPAPDALFCASDTIAIGALKALGELGLSVPADVAVVGFDDIPAASLTHPPLTTIAQPYLLAGEMLVDALLKLIRGETAETILLPGRLIVRGSTTG
ncbi:LacI family DNA-binding transcriptional regulator [Sphingomonas sp.]|uniref:LacI family DNA-binding transcriptional regulator n=1 Tax=Sphingomonas sp. TaxID=28214 RepID=UPI001D369B2D|nr:LacI family DNA-binding transcriptional regulator [Sphingomonas sp.]MBX9795929.1 LacI family DNA-binding transcriptional regulator [Sphingomonas sp.]